MKVGRLITKKKNNIGTLVGDAALANSSVFGRIALHIVFSQHAWWFLLSTFNFMFKISVKIRLKGFKVENYIYVIYKC